jgi:hypothetical protein
MVHLLICYIHYSFVRLLLAKWVKAYHLDPTIDMIAYLKPIVEQKLSKRHEGWEKRRARSLARAKG